MKSTLSFFFPSSKGNIKILVGQCYRPNHSIKKINHFQSLKGYATWVVAVSKNINLSYKEVEEATQRAIALVATGVANSTVVQEVA